MGWPGPMTHRQYVAWQGWLKTQWNEPSRQDWYAMRIASAVLNAGGVAAEPKDMKLRFEAPKQAPAMTEEERVKERTMESKSIWKAWLSSARVKDPVKRAK